MKKGFNYQLALTLLDPKKLADYTTDKQQRPRPQKGIDMTSTAKRKRPRRQKASDMTPADKRKKAYRGEAQRQRRLFALHGATKNCDGQMPLEYAIDVDPTAAATTVRSTRDDT